MLWGIENNPAEDSGAGTWDKWLQEPDQSWAAASANYRATVDLMDRFNDGVIGLGELLEALRGRELDGGHPSGCSYLATPSLLPPSGASVRFDARVMPADYSGTIGELVMVQGLLGDEAFVRVHAALHPTSQHCAPCASD